MRKSLGTILWVAAAIVALLFWALSGEIGKEVGKSAVKSFAEGQKQGALEKVVADAAEELRKQAPIKVDEITTLTTAISVGERLIYHHILSLSKNDAKHFDWNKLKRNITYNSCSRMKEGLDAGLNILGSIIQVMEFI